MLCNVAPSDGSGRGANEWTETVDADGLSTLLCLEHIRQSAAADGKRSGTTESGKKAEGHHLSFGLSEAAAEVPCEVEQVCQLQDENSPEDLRERTEEQGTNGVGEDEKGQHESLFDLFGDAKVF